MIRKKINTYTVGHAKSVQQWHGALQGVPCFVVGNGPSLNRQPVELLTPYFTIGINRAFYKIDPTILMWQDVQLWHTDKHKLLKTEAIKYCRERADVQGRYYHFRISPGNYGFPRNASAMVGRGSTGPLAFQLAWVLGCDPIILLGMDCCYEGKYTDFYGTNPMHRPHTLRNCRKGLAWIHGSKHGREVINCSENTIFPEQRELEEVIKSIPALKPLGREYLNKKLLYHHL